MKLIAFLFLSTILMMPSLTLACDTKTHPEHWYAEVLAEFIKAGGCAVQGPSTGTRIISAPYFAVTKLNTKAIASLKEPFDMKTWNPESAVRPILEKLSAREDILIIIAPMTDNTGAVFSDKDDPEFLAQMRKHLAFVPGIEKVKTLFVLSNATNVLTVVHENQHVQDVLEGRLPLSVDKKNKLISDIEAAAKRTPSEADKELIFSWLRAIFRGLPEIAAIQAEYKFMLSKGEFRISFVDYLKNNGHDYINKQGGTAWANESLKKDATTDFLKEVAGLVCNYTKETATDLRISEFQKIFSNCY